MSEQPFAKGYFTDRFEAGERPVTPWWPDGKAATPGRLIARAVAAYVAAQNVRYADRDRAVETAYERMVEAIERALPPAPTAGQE